MRRLVLLVAGGLLLAGLAGCGSQSGPDGGDRAEGDAEAAQEVAPSPTTDGCTTGTTVPARSDRDLVYAEVDGVDPNLLSLDLDVPAHDACAPPPVVVFVHGGGWRQGDKDGAAIEDKRRLFTEAGFAFASTNYRLSPEPRDPTDPDRVTYPTHPQDVASALALLDARAAELGVDADRVALVGHSAGAGIVSTLGTDEGFLAAAGLDPTQVACTVSLDTEAYDVAEGAQTPGEVGLTYQNAFTTDPEVWSDASPTNHVDGSEAPFLVVTRGTPKRVAMATAFVHQLDQAGVHATVLDVSPYTHDEANRQLGAPGETTLTEPVLDFVQECLDGD